MKNRRLPLTAAQAAKALRAPFESVIQKTWADYFNPSSAWVTAYGFTKMVQEQARCSFQEAAVAVGAEVPELFASYWEALAQPGTVVQAELVLA